MKLGYRERITLLIVFVLLVLGVGFFAFIKPKYEKYQKNKEDLKNLENEWETQLALFDRIPAKQENIDKRYKKGLEIADEFTDEMTSVELDEFFREQFMNTEKFKEDGVKLVSNFSVTDEESTSMNYYYVTPNVVTYPLVEYADLDGSLAEATKEIRKESDVLSTQKVQNAGGGTSVLTVRINREDTMTLLDAVDKYRQDHKDAMMIVAVSIEDYSFNEDVEEAEAAPQFQTVVDDEGNEVQVPATPEDAVETDDGEKVYPGFTEVTIAYNSYYMQEPTKPDVGPTYDAGIWDTDNWRDPVSEG